MKNRVFWNGFWAGYGRAQFVFLFPFLMAFYADDGTATAFSVSVGYLVWSIGSWVYAFGAGDDAVREHNERNAS